MKIRNNTFRMLAGLLLSLIGLGTGLAQPPTPVVMPQQTVREDVAILVVDVFEEALGLHAGSAVTKGSLTGNCAVSVVGQDGLAVRGNVSSELFPLTHPHGNLVSQHIKNVLANEYNGTTQTNNNISFVNAPDTEYWETPFGNIWLVGVDTQDYQIDMIATNVQSAIRDLNATKGVNHFVVNMSFGIVPCSKFPEVSAEAYIDQLSRWGINPPYDTTKPVGQLGDALANIVGSADELKDLIDLRNNNPSISDAFGLLHRSLVQSILKDIFAVLPKPTPGGDKDSFNLFDPNIPDVTVVQVASAGNDGYDYPYYPAQAQNVLSVSAAYSPYDCAPHDRAQVYTYLNGELGFSGIAVDQIIHNALSPMSNYGDVIENGVSTIGPQDYLLNYVGGGQDTLGCLNGTSFAAPRMSILMAFDQTSASGSSCVVGSPIPPLAHGKWDNINVEAAAALYCPGFPR